LQPSRVKRPQRSLAGFDVGQSMPAAQAVCSSSGRRWHVAGDSWHCSGFAPSIGLPLSVELWAPRQTVKEIRAYYAIGHDNPHAILDALVKLMVGRFGEPSYVRPGYVSWTGSNWTDGGDLRVFSDGRRAGMLFVTPP
jgi:hypothetical protein